MGKSTVVYIVGLLCLVSYAMRNINEGSLSARSSSDAYYIRTVNHNRAVAGANLGTRLIMSDSSSSGSLTRSFAGGTFNVTFHPTASEDTVRIVSTSSAWDPMTNGAIFDTVISTVSHTSFSQFAYFSEVEVNGYLAKDNNNPPGGNMWKVTGDSLFGFAHTNGHWNLGGSPYFRDLITAKDPPNTMNYLGLYAPVFNNGYAWGATKSRPAANVTKLEQAAVNGSASAYMSYTEGEDVALTFFSDGKVNLKIPATTGTIRNQTLPLSSITSTGIIGVKRGDIHVKGIYKGQVTLVALSGSDAYKGNIWIDGNIVAATDPAVNPTSTDMLGLVAERMAYITKDLTRTPASVLNIQAAIYTQRGVFAAEDYSTIPLSGRIKLFGALAMGASTSTGKMESGVLAHGFFKSISTDQRYLKTSPPMFPRSGNYDLVAWWEK